jgi:hypothetical protein
MEPMAGFSPVDILKAIAPWVAKMKKFVIVILNPIRNNSHRSRQACLGDRRLRGGAREAVLATMEPSLMQRTKTSFIHLNSQS